MTNTRSFNGAATCSLRNAAILIHLEVGEEDLQWGRNMFLAECPVYPRRMPATAIPPSMGPQHVRCGITNWEWSHIANPALQWGRNMFVAECGILNGLLMTCTMPSMGPQHVRCGMHSNIHMLTINTIPSMGPQHVRCGMYMHPRQTPHLTEIPSMGPQHVRCGMVDGRVHIDAGRRRLQWGRNMFVAECRRKYLGRPITNKPSMGPQHVRCGMLAIQPEP